MSFKLCLIPAAAAACVIAACGGGDAGAPPQPVVAPAPTPTSGVAVDGYLVGATVLCDSNGNGLADTGEVTTTTLNGGAFTFAAGCAAGVVVTGGTNADTGLPFKGMLKAPVGATVASPLTTLLVAGMTQAQVNAALGLPAATNLLTTDPALRSGGILANPDLLKKTLALQQLLQKTAEAMAGLGGATDSVTLQAIYGEVATAFGVLLKGGATLNTGTTVDAAVVANLVKAAADRVALSTTVSPAVKAAVAAVNAESLGVVTAGALKSQSEALLKAADADIVAVTTSKQGDATIATFVVSNAGQITAPPTAATTTLGSTLTAQVNPPSGPGPTGSGDTLAATVTAATIDFAAAKAGMTAFGTDGGGSASIVPDPTKAANPVLKFIKMPGDQVWAGATVYTDAAASTIAPVALTAADKSITLRVYSPAAGAKILLKLESGLAGAADVEVQVNTTLARAWETLTFNFPAPGTYRKLSLFPAFDTKVATESTFYFDSLVYNTAVPAPTDYVAVATDTISLANGSASTSYTMDQFQSAAGLSVAWPMPSPMMLKVSVAEVGSYTLAADQKLTAAVVISETTASGKGELRGYISNVAVSKTAGGLLISVPTGAADSLVYAVSSDGKKTAIIDFGASVAGVKNTLTTTSGSVNSIVLGSVVNYAINKVSNDFTDIYRLRGKYKVSIVINGLPLRKADGSELPAQTLTVPTALDNKGAVANSKTVTGIGLVGHITLTD
jgi:hypothetical protein